MVAFMFIKIFYRISSTQFATLTFRSTIVCLHSAEIKNLAFESTQEGWSQNKFFLLESVSN